MTRNEAIEHAKKALAETGVTQYVVRRGDKYNLYSETAWVFAPSRGWKVAEVISRGNVHNF